MDTLFRLVSLQSSSSSSDQKHNHHFSSSPSNTYLLPTSSSSSAPYLELPEQECGFFAHYNHLPYYFSMDNNTTNNNHSITNNNNNQDTTSSSKHPADVLLLPDPPSPYHHDYLQVFFSDPSRRWASDLLLDCAAAVASRDTPRVKHLMWILNELASPYADLVDHKLASYFLQALFARLTSSGPRTLRTLSSASDRSSSFDSTRRTALRFQELSPWSSFGHLAANSSILDSFFLHPHPRLHILDLSTTFCTQWPTLLESLATRSSGADDTPHLSITAIVPSASPAARRVMREISARMDKFGRLMAVPFRFSVIHHPNSDLSSLDLHSLIPVEDSSVSTTFLAVNCVNSLHGVPPSTRRRDALLAKIRRLRPEIITVVEEEAELDFPIGDNNNGDEEEDDVFLKVFKEGLRFFSAYFDSLEECFPKTSGERLALERAAGRAVVDLVACPAEESAERRDVAAGWSRRMRNAGFRNLGFSDDVNDDLRALLKRYKEGWGMQAEAPVPEVTVVEEVEGGGTVAGAGVFLTWKEEPVVWASAWKLA